MQKTILLYTDELTPNTPFDLLRQDLITNGYAVDVLIAGQRRYFAVPKLAIARIDQSVYRRFRYNDLVMEQVWHIINRAKYTLFINPSETPNDTNDELHPIQRLRGWSNQINESLLQTVEGRQYVLKKQVDPCFVVVPLVLSTSSVTDDPLVIVREYLERNGFFKDDPNADSIDLKTRMSFLVDYLRGEDEFGMRLEETQLQKTYDDYSFLIRLNLPDVAQDYMIRAKVLIRREMFAEALADLNAAVKADPNNMNYYVTRGKLLFDLEEFHAAREDFTSAIRLDPDYKYYDQRGQIYEKLGDIDSALADYEKVLKVKERHNTVRPHYEALMATRKR